MAVCTEHGGIAVFSQILS